ncbi:MAG: hypothetical protein ACE5FH_09910 [Candidatus Zixiibacteriota bacterium]
MDKKVSLIGLLVLAVGEQAHAANLAMIASPPTAMNLVVLIVFGASVAGGVKVLSAVRGGQLSKSWQLFVMGFFVMGLSQLAVICHSLELLELPEFVTPALLLVSAALFLYGVLETRRTLS